MSRISGREWFSLGLVAAGVVMLGAGIFVRDATVAGASFILLIFSGLPLLVARGLRP